MDTVRNNKANSNTSNNNKGVLLEDFDTPIYIPKNRLQQHQQQRQQQQHQQVTKVEQPPKTKPQQASKLQAMQAFNIIGGGEPVAIRGGSKKKKSKPIEGKEPVSAVETF